MYTLIYKPEEIPFSLSSLRKFLRLGLRSAENLPVLEMAGNFYRKYLSIIHPAAKYTFISILKTEEESEQVFLKNDIILSGKGIYNLLKNSDYAAIYCLTLGKRLDEIISELQSDEFYEAYLLDSIASALTSGLQDLVSLRISEQAKDMERQLTKRFSPGYPGWELQQQKYLFSMLNPEDIGIKLTEDFYMLPKKTVSGVYGFYR